VLRVPGKLYSGLNGDRWHLCRDTSGYVLALHQPDILSDGGTFGMEVSDFLSHGRGGSLIPNDFLAKSYTKDQLLGAIAKP
jgi:hypothetical protein